MKVPYVKRLSQTIDGARAPLVNMAISSLVRTNLIQVISNDPIFFPNAKNGNCITKNKKKNKKCSTLNRGALKSI